MQQHPHPEAACKAIVQHALAQWRALEAADNITVLVVRLVWAGEEVLMAPASSMAPSSATEPSTEPDAPFVPATALQVHSAFTRCGSNSWCSRALVALA